MPEESGSPLESSIFCFPDKHAWIRCCFLVSFLARQCFSLLCCPAGCPWIQVKEGLSITLRRNQKSNIWLLQVPAAYKISLTTVAAGTVSLWEQFSPRLAETSPWHHDFGMWQKVQGSTGYSFPSVSLIHQLEECPADKTFWSCSPTQRCSQ